MDAQLSSSLQASLGSGYTLVGELGGGSMSRVFVAEEHALGRRVVVKVLPHYLATEVSLERFRREIQLAAQLQHPLIVPVLSAGESDGMRYYTMPYIAGESLRSALSRHGSLAVEHVITIMQDVASALAYAHRRGVVHRDIKPDNILLSEDHALVTDFGVAKALESASIRHLQVTSDGEAVGTAAYMAPEQVTGDASIDHRVDIYALGIVAYELLTGHPPFTGQSLHGILTAHLADDPIPPVELRREIGDDLSDLVLTCLAKKPADRWQSADQLLEALEGFGVGSRRSLSRVTSAEPVVGEDGMKAPTSWGRNNSGGARTRSGLGPAQSSGGARRRQQRTRLTIAAVAAAIVVAGVGTWLALRDTDPPPASAGAGSVAVLPFRVVGSDSSLGYLREGMVDLLTAKLGGGSTTPHALDPRSVLNAWREAVGDEGGELSEEQAVAIARRLGAQRVVLGGIVGTPGNLVLTATLRDVATGESTPAEVNGHPDSVLTLVDRMAAQLLAIGARVERTRLADATSRSLPALKEYLVGQSFYRRGSFEQSRNHFQKALQLDSTFALAALGNAASGAYGQPTEALRQLAGVDQAFRLRAKLSPRDQALFDAYVPARYPRERSAALDLATWQKATIAAPELPELWYGYADRLFHTGAWLGIDRPWERAKPSFARALEMDSTFVPPLSHLVEIAINEGDTASVRRLSAMYFARDSAADEADGIRWRVSVALRDRRLHERIDAEMPTFAVSTLARIMALGQIENTAYEDVERAAATMRTIQTTTTTVLQSRLALHNLALNSGQPREALAALAPLRTPGAPARVTGSFYNLPQLIVLDALYGAGDAQAAAEEVRALEARIAEPNLAAHEPRAEQYADVCTAELWRVRHGDVSTVDRSLARLRAGSNPRDSSGYHGGNPDLCAAILEGELALVRDTSSARQRAIRLDSIMLEGPTRYGADFGNMVAARLFERAGDLARARAALMRRPYYAYPGTIFLSEVLLHRARLSARLQDRADALRSFRHYLALRGRAPEPEFKSQVETVRREIAAIEKPAGGG